MKKVILLTAVILLSAASALAQNGTTGQLEWVLDNGTLTINGEGEMPDYSNSYNDPDSVPWVGEFFWGKSSLFCEQ